MESPVTLQEYTSSTVGHEVCGCRNLTIRCNIFTELSSLDKVTA